MKLSKKYKKLKKFVQFSQEILMDFVPCPHMKFDDAKIFTQFLRSSKESFKIFITCSTFLIKVTREDSEKNPFVSSSHVFFAFITFAFHMKFFY
jgi:hypothetical protein